MAETVYGLSCETWVGSEIQGEVDLYFGHPGEKTAKGYLCWRPNLE